MNEEHNGISSEPGYDLGTFNFLRVGWWALHLIGIAGVAYLGFWYGTQMMK